jgi:hypothetical protein
VVAPGFLQNPEVRRWLNGVEPAWMMLEFNSLNALRHEPSGSNQAIRLEPDLADAEISGSAVTANALLLLRRAAETGGLKLTATGNLSRAMVEEMFGIIKAPDYDKTELLRFQKVINEPDFLPLHFIRILTQAAKLIRTHRGKMIPTPLGRRMLAAEQHGPLQALLFHAALWHMNIAYFDRYPLDSWPQRSGGHPVVAFGIGTRLAAERDTHAALRVSRDRRSGVAMGRWFQRHGGPHSPTTGLVRASGIANPSEVGDRVGCHPSIYRKAPLLDRFVRFDVQIEGPDTRH